MNPRESIDDALWHARFNWHVHGGLMDYYRRILLLTASILPLVVTALFLLTSFEATPLGGVGGRSLLAAAGFLGAIAMLAEMKRRDHAMFRWRYGQLAGDCLSQLHGPPEQVTEASARHLREIYGHIESTEPQWVPLGFHRLKTRCMHRTNAEITPEDRSLLIYRAGAGQ